MSFRPPKTAEEKADYHLFSRKFYRPQYARYRPARAEAFALMRAAGERVVPHFRIGPQLPPSLLCVVYINEAEHATKGKALLTVAEALEQGLDGRLASQFLGGGADGKSRHTRLLVIGLHAFWQHFTSDDAWRGNAGEVSIRTERASLPANASAYAHQQALYAIDYVSAAGREYAVDFNVSPGIPREAELLEGLEGGDLLGALTEFYRQRSEVTPYLVGAEP